MNWFLKDGSTWARLVRTLAEVVLSWLIANLGDIFNLFTLEPTIKALLISFLTVVFTAVLGFVNEGRKDADSDGLV